MHSIPAFFRGIFPILAGISKSPFLLLILKGRNCLLLWTCLWNVLSFLLHSPFPFHFAFCSFCLPSFHFGSLFNFSLTRKSKLCGSGSHFHLQFSEKGGEYNWDMSPLLFFKLKCNNFSIMETSFSSSSYLWLLALERYFISCFQWLITQVLNNPGKVQAHLWGHLEMTSWIMFSKRISGNCLDHYWCLVSRLGLREKCSAVCEYLSVGILSSMKNYTYTLETLISRSLGTCRK